MRPKTGLALNGVNAVRCGLRGAVIWTACGVKERWKQSEERKTEKIHE